GAATGKIVFTAEDAVEWRKKGEKVLLVRSETSPEDVHVVSVWEGWEMTGNRRTKILLWTLSGLSLLLLIPLTGNVPVYSLILGCADTREA
ncbi:MAG: hypothetical protein QW279_02380, partial [Candidatus Jordarchaeaceae archaeon]